MTSWPNHTRLVVLCTVRSRRTILHEWIWGDWLKHDYDVWKALGIRDKDSFRSWIDGKCVWFLAVEELANGTKHFIRDQGFETMRIGGYGQDWVPPYGKGYLLIDYGEGAGEHRWQPAALPLEVVVRFWRDFFRKYRPSPDLPVSKHHAD